MIPRIEATVIFVRDLAGCAAFYQDTLGFTVQQSDTDSVSFKLGDQYFLLLNMAGAVELLSTEVEKLTAAGAPRVLLAAGVEDVDAAYEDLKTKGVTFLRPPTDQPWGLRTAHFADPEGNLWEINQPIST